ncbi:MAG: RNA polymerase sigma factor [Lachnospiraceae bacterium]|nr:RNA polymerase sigma factor [Lachnospiraceae bacterium]
MDFTELYDQHAGRMFRLASAILRNPHDAEDAVQEAFLTVARKKDFYAAMSKEKLAAALTVIVKSRAIDILRRRTESADMDLIGQTLPDAAVSVTSGILLEEAIASLPGRQRDVLLLSCADGFTTAEIAEMTGLTRENVRKLLYRAKKQVRAYMEEETK